MIKILVTHDQKPKQSGQRSLECFPLNDEIQAKSTEAKECTGVDLLYDMIFKV